MLSWQIPHRLGVIDSRSAGHDFCRRAVLCEPRGSDEIAPNVGAYNVEALAHFAWEIRLALFSSGIIGAAHVAADPFRVGAPE
jgi:hypothetical protein